MIGGPFERRTAGFEGARIDQYVLCRTTVTESPSRTLKAPPFSASERVRTPAAILVELVGTVVRATGLERGTDPAWPQPQAVSKASTASRDR